MYIDVWLLALHQKSLAFYAINSNCLIMKKAFHKILLIFYWTCVTSLKDICIRQIDFMRYLNQLTLLLFPSYALCRITPMFPQIGHFNFDNKIQIFPWTVNFQTVASYLYFVILFNYSIYADIFIFAFVQKMIYIGIQIIWWFFKGKYFSNYEHYIRHLWFFSQAF
jgi:hypothetical protein